MKSFASLGLLLLTVAGCSSVPYSKPTSGPTASILFVNYASRNLEVAFYEQSKGCKARRAVPVLSPPNQAEYTVRADAELTFQYYLTNFGDQPREEYCLLNLRFVPRAGARYEIRAAEEVAHCRWEAHDITDKKNPQKITLTAIPWKAGFAENSSFCAE